MSSGNKRNKYKRLNWIIWITVITIIIFGYIDSVQIKAVEETKEWAVYERYVSPSFVNSWILALILMAVIYFILTRDISESLAVFLVPWLLMKSGLEDVAFLVFTKNTGMECMEWFGPFQNTISRLLGETCVSFGALVLNVVVFGVLVWLLFRWLRRCGW